DADLVDAIDDADTVQVNVSSQTTTASDSNFYLLAVGNFSEEFAFEIDPGTHTDASFVVSADSLATVLSDMAATLQMNVDGSWVDVASTEGGGVLNLLT